MSCLTVQMNRIGGMTAEMERIGGMTAEMRCKSGMVVEMWRNGGMVAEMTLKRNVNMSLGLVCGTCLGLYDILWSSTDALITYQNNRILVRRKNV